MNQGRGLAQREAAPSRAKSGPIERESLAAGPVINARLTLQSDSLPGSWNERFCSLTGPRRTILNY